MEGLGIGGAVFFLKTPKAGKQITQIYYEKGQTVIVEPNTPRWNELMGRFKLEEYFISPELWSAAQSIRELRGELFEDKDKIRIIVKRTVEGFGDVIMMTVIPKAFKEAFGDDVEVDVFVDPSFVQLLEGNPYIDKILTENFNEKEYDLALNANSVDFKTETKESEIEQKYRRNRTNLYLQQLGLWLIDRTPVYVVSEREKKWAKNEVKEMTRPIIAVQQEASVKSKTYPHMQKVVEDLVSSGHGVVVLDGKHSDGKYDYTLRQMAALINESDIVVSPDSLALHLAGALKKRGVGIFGYTEGKVIAQDYEKIHPFQAACPYKKPPCWWSIDCLEGDSTREKEIAGHCHCLEQLEHNWILEAIEGQRVAWSRPPIFLTMLTYNLLNMTKKAIASIKSKHNYKLMVVDNESTDGTQEWLKEQGIPFVSKKSSVSEAQNIAMKEFLKGDGEYFIFLNNDIVLRMDYIDELIKAQKRTGAWGIVGDLIKDIPPWAVDDVKIIDKWDKECVDIPAGSYSATLLTRECIEKVGFFDEQYTPRYIEDNDYTLRIRLSGGSFYFTSHAQFFHVLGAVVNAHPEEAKRNQERWDRNIAKFKTKFGIHPHEAQDLKKVNLEQNSIKGPKELENTKEIITVITPTGDRPLAFALCEKWMESQTVQPDQWIVIDDGKVPLVPHVSMEYVRREPHSSDPECTQLLNLRVAATLIKGNKILLVEDDDYYAPKYIETMVAKLDEHEIIGIGKAKYYHLFSGGYYRHGNIKHASLAEMAFWNSFLLEFKEELKSNQVADDTGSYLDVRLWKRLREQGRGFIFFDDDNELLHVGIKGLPGRLGIAPEHSSDHYIYKKYIDDESRKLLKQWIPKDYGIYMDIIAGKVTEEIYQSWFKK